MLIEFRVQNYRSIREEQVLSLVAAEDKSHADTHIIATENKTTPKLVKSSVIYGANASGKTNLLKALIFMRALVEESATKIQLGQKLNIQPFSLDSATSEQPSEFEVTFLENNIRYQYGFRASAERIHEEWLLVYKTSKAQRWFSRSYNPNSNTDEYEFGSHFIGQRKLWQESTRQNGLFLSTAVNLNSEQLQPIFNWIVSNLVCFPADAQLLPDFSIMMLQNIEKKDDIQKFMSLADIGISNIEIESKKGLSKGYTLDFATGQATELKNEETNILTPKFSHKTDKGIATFDLGDESHGTRQFFSLAGPVLEILKAGKVLISDELNKSLHPLLVKHLIGLFNSSELNPNGAQLIFTTHDTALLDKDVFRRDQIWFVEKNSNQESKLYPLTDFSPRKNEALEKGYLIGRYGAVPYLEDFKD